jgi:PST family polysaccharide transporter
MPNINESHKQILKSTGIVGGAQVFSIIIGIVRTKVIAVLLGPSGIGILGILQSTVDLIRNATGFGINFSGVKDVAESSASGNQQQIAKTITILRSWALVTGLLGMLITIALCIPLSNYSFGNDSYALSIAIISLTLVITSISASQIALLQGLRLIGQMAKATILGALLSTIITLPLYWLLGINGIVPAMILTTLISLFVSWLFTRKIKIKKPDISFSDTFKGGWNMARLGFFIVISGFISIATMYIVRKFIVTKLSIDAVGYFQAAWTISTMYINIVLNAMQADFFPRLSAINKDNIASNKLINEQLQMALVVGSPMIISLISCAGIAIHVLYSSKFSTAISILQWQMAGSFFVLILWPMGVMFLAKNKGVFSIIINIVWSFTYLLLVFFGWEYFGFKILGIAYFVAAIFQLLFVFFSTRYLGKFSFSTINLHYIIIFGVATLISMLNVLVNEGYVQYIISGLIMIIVLIFSYSQLKKIINIKMIFRTIILRR